MSESSLNLSKIIRQLFYILFFASPLILWPFTSEVFEFNKMMFVYLLTILITSAWLIKSFINKKFEFAKTPLDLPIVLFLVSQIISTIISIDPHTSLWGYYSRFHGGFMSTISYIILFYALVTHFSNEIKAINNLISAILFSATLISLYAILEHFGIDKTIWVQDVQNRVFSTLGQPNWLSAFLVAILPLSLFQAISYSKNIHQRLLYFGLSFLYFIAILYTKSQSGIAATAVILLLFFIITSIKNKKIWLLLLLIPLSVSVLIFKGNYVRQTLGSLNKINPFYSNTLSIINEENKTRIGGSDSMTIRRVVWEGAIKLGLKRPFFGTGVETFGYTYYWVRPATHNLTSESEFLYNKAHNEYLNYFATSGFIGLLTYLFLTGSIIYLFTNNKGVISNEAKQTQFLKLRLPLLLGIVSILITNYIGFSVVNVALFFYLYPAIYIASIGKNIFRYHKINFDSNWGIFIIFILATWFIIGLSKAWLADLAYNKGKGSLEESEKAVRLNPKEPIYYAQLGNINALVATQIIAPQIANLPVTASAEIKQQANLVFEKYINQATTNIQKAQSLNSYNINVLKIKAKTELTLASINSNYYQEALNTLLRISELSPTDSTNFINIGILYQNNGKSELAKKAFEQALYLNPNSESAKEYLKKITFK